MFMRFREALIGLGNFPCANPVQMKKGFKLNRLKPLSVLWAHLGSNQGPPDYESGALTN